MSSITFLRLQKCEFISFEVFPRVNFVEMEIKKPFEIVFKYPWYILVRKVNELDMSLNRKNVDYNRIEFLIPSRQCLPEIATQFKIFRQFRSKIRLTVVPSALIPKSAKKNERIWEKFWRATWFLCKKRFLDK